jgi:glycosyltransferase involved in cell wall biosynthesis
MKIGIDTQSMVGFKTGIGYYTKNLVQSLLKEKDFDFYTYKDESLKNLNTLQRIRWENFSLVNLARKDKIDLLHIPGFAGPLLKAKYKRVTTVHDLIGLIYPSNLGPISRFYWQKWLPLCIRNSDAIIADSENTRRDIINLLNIKGEKITVIPLAADNTFSKLSDTHYLNEIAKKYSLPADFILTVGTIEPRKNIPLLIESFASYIQENNNNLKLLIVGKQDWGFPEVQKTIYKLRINDRVRFTGYVEDTELSAFYNLAKAFVYPSLYEGFGLPVLEALSCGVPVICSNISSLPEIVADAAILISPYNASEIKNAIKRMNENSYLRQEFSERGIQQAKKFSWERTIQQIREVYKKFCN